MATFILASLSIGIVVFIAFAVLLVKLTLEEDEDEF